MRHLLLALHLVVAIFAVGPLVGAATTASRAVRLRDADGMAAAAKTIRRYAYASILVPILGMGLVQSKWNFSFSQTWIWLSLLLYLAALALALTVLVPALTRAPSVLADGQAPASGASDGLSARIAASGGLIAVLFVVIVFLMVYKPGR